MPKAPPKSIHGTFVAAGERLSRTARAWSSAKPRYSSRDIDKNLPVSAVETKSDKLRLPASEQGVIAV